MLEFEFEGTTWELDGPEEFPEACLLTTLKINGVLHHCSAVAVVQQIDPEAPDLDSPDIQIAAHDAFNDVLDDLDTYDGGDGPFSAVKIPGYPDHDYIVVITPYRR